jgi:outer membrane protein assembly factor BamA
MLRRVTDVCLAAVLLLACGASSVDAQGSRAELLERMRAEKAKNVRPHEPGRLEKLLLKVDPRYPLARIAPHNGFFAEWGYTHKPIGSGIGFGGGFRHDLFDRTARVELEGGWTFRNYQLARADFSLPYLANDRVELGVEATYHHHPQEDFYGLGAESLEAGRVSYRLDNRQFEGRAVVRPREQIEVGLRVGRMSPALGPGTDSRFPSLEMSFDDTTAPGLAVQPDFTYVDLSGGLDYRDEPGNARTGGYYTAAWRRHSDGELDRYGFDRVDVRLQQFLPIFDKKRVFAVQARLTTTHPRDGQETPFYFKPTVGGPTSLRSVADYRFRDDSAVFFNLEYRWEAFGLLDMALFTDWGTVAPHASDLDLGDMTRAYGIGFRFNTAEAVFFRFDIAVGGGEGVRYLTKFSKIF